MTTRTKETRNREVDELKQLIDEEKELIDDRQFALTMMACCDSVIQEADRVEYTRISDDFKKQKEAWHQKWREANSRLKAIGQEIYNLT